MEQGWGSDGGAKGPTGADVIRPGEAGVHPNIADGMGTDSSAEGWKNLDPMSGHVDPQNWDHVSTSFDSDEGWKQI